jgi:GxxExxY protein
MLTRTTSPLSPELERIVTRTIGCALRVHQELGPGYIEGLYQDAMAIELEAEGLTFYTRSI